MIERQRQRNVVKNMFERSPAAEACSVLSWDYKKESKSAPVGELVEYWGQVF